MNKPSKGSSRCSTRRKFLKDAALAVGGVTLASWAATSACGPSQNTSTSGIGTEPSDLKPTPTSSQSSPMKSTASTLNPAQSTPPSSTVSPSNSITTFDYIPSNEGMEMLPVPGTVTFVASDRLYTVEHTWVKLIADNKVAIGITDKLQKLMDVVISIKVTDEGGSLIKGEFCGYFESFKLNVDFVAPVSGTVLQTNWLLTQSLGSPSHVVHIDPYVRGWLQVIQISKPTELEELLSPQEYIALNAKTEEKA